MFLENSKINGLFLNTDKNMPEKYKKRIKTIEKIEQNDIIKTIVRTIGGKL